MFNCCSHGTLLHFSPQGSHLYTCYYHQDLHIRQLHPVLRPQLRCLPYRPPTRSSAIHFQGWLIRQVSCYTLLSGFRLPWPPSCCLYQPTPFVVSHERRVRHLNCRVRFIPHRQFCLPKMAHWALTFSILPNSNQESSASHPFQV
jgi:hypothetical protein